MNSAHPLIRALANVTFAPATASKRFVRDVASLAPDRELSARQEAFAWRIAWIFRRQMPAELVKEAEARKISHQWRYSSIANPRAGETCAVCGNRLFSERERNRPCPGPREVKPTKAKKVAMVADTKQLELETLA